MKEPLNLMLILVPIAIVLEVMHADPLYIFIASALAIIRWQVGWDAPPSGWPNTSDQVSEVC